MKLFPSLHGFPADSTAFTQSVSSLEFVVNSANLSDTQCYNISVDFDVDDICDHSSDCSDIVLLSYLTKTNNNDYVSLIVGRDSTEVSIKLPEKMYNVMFESIFLN